MRPKLVLIAGKADKAEIRLKLPTIVGRTQEAGLMIAHKTVSRRHCELFERHGMLFVRDTGSRNGTLVDNAPIKESMLKPGHTLTIGPLTFRADYEPADSFIQSDDADGPASNGATNASAKAGATTAMKAHSVDDETTIASPRSEATPTSTVQSVKHADTPQSGELEFEEFGAADKGELDLPAMVDSDGDLGEVEFSESDFGAEDLGGDIGAQQKASASAEEAFSLDDDLGMEFNLDEAPAEPMSEAAVEEGDEVISFAMTDDPTADGLPEAEAGLPDLDSPELGGGDDEIMSFDLSDEPGTPAKSADKQEDALGGLLDDDDDLGFKLDDAAKPASSGGDEMDELGFTLEDLEEPILGPDPVVIDSPDENGEGDGEMTFEIAEDPEPPKAVAKPASKPAPPAPAKPAPSDAGAKVQLGEEKGAGGDAGMSAFLKDLGL